MESRDKLISDLTTSLKRVKTFSCPEFKDVYSKAYFQEIIKPLIENDDSNYAFIFGDFNKLGVINDVYGHDFGDNALNIAIKIIKKSLPKDALIVRAGGDELYLILPNSDKKLAEKYSNLINKNLHNNAVLMGGLSIELASSDSTHGNLDNLISQTDNEVTSAKAARKEDNSPADILTDDFLPLQVPKSYSKGESDAWEKLNNLINISTYEFLQNFRPTKNFEFKVQQIIDSSDFITNSFIALLNEKTNSNLPKKVSSLLKADYPYSPDFTVQNDSINKVCFDKNTASLIHSLVTKGVHELDSDKLSDTDLQNINDSLSILLESLVRDNTGLLNKQYFRYCLAEEICNSDVEYSASYYSFPGLKLCNFAYDHSFSDKRLDRTNKLLCDEAKKELNFNNQSFDFSDKNIYLLSQGGGNYLCLYPKEFKEDIKQKIVTIMDKVNSKVDLKNPNSYFQVSSYFMNKNQSISNGSPLDVIKYVRGLKEETNYGKVSMKKSLFKSADAFFAFKKSINNCVDYYLKNIPNASKDVDKMIQFMRNVYTSFLNQEVLHNDTRKDKKTAGLSNYNEFYKE